MSSVSVPESPVDTFGATLRVVMELPADKLGTPRQVFPKYSPTSSELLTDDLGNTFEAYYQLVAGSGGEFLKYRLLASCARVCFQPKISSNALSA